MSATDACFVAPELRLISSLACGGGEEDWSERDKRLDICRISFLVAIRLLDDDGALNSIHYRIIEALLLWKIRCIWKVLLPWHCGTCV